MKFEEMNYDELTELLHDAIECQDICLYKTIKKIFDERTARYE